MDPERIGRLERAVCRELNGNSSGLGEFELIGRLREAGWSEFERKEPADPLALFRRHFLLFHILYRLRDRLRKERVGELTIGALCIALRPYRLGSAGIVTSDPLREFYLDLSQLACTTEEDVKALLSGFWRRLEADGEKTSALALMGLEEPVGYAAVKYRYRQLAMRHHPDRGGDHRRLQALNDAMHILARYYGR